MSKRSYNYSAIQAAYRCLKYYKLLYVDQMKTEMPASADMEFGTALHAGLDCLLEDGQGEEVFNLYWDTLANKELKYTRYKYDDLAKLGPIFLERFNRLHKKHILPVQKEVRLYSKLEEIRIEGTPDVVGYYKGIPSIIDFKTSSQPYDKKKIECSEQMYLYAYMAMKELKLDIQQLVYVVFCKSDCRIQVITYPIDPIKLKSMLDNVLAVCHDLESRQVFTANRNSCIGCDYWNVCYEGSKDATTSNANAAVDTPT